MFNYSPDHLIRDIRTLLEQHSGGLPEYDLIHLLCDQGYSGFQTNASNNLAVFQTHFFLMHCLYLLRDQLRSEKCAELVIDPINIHLESFQTGHAGIIEEDPMRAYYLDLEHLASTTADDVEEMLRRFGRRRQSSDERKIALDALGLDENASDETIRKRYRKLAMVHHPDRGGDEEKLKTIHEAMRILVD